MCFLLHTPQAKALSVSWTGIEDEATGSIAFLASLSWGLILTNFRERDVQMSRQSERQAEKKAASRYICVCNRQFLPNRTDDRLDLIQGFLPHFVSWTGIEKEATG